MMTLVVNLTAIVTILVVVGMRISVLLCWKTYLDFIFLFFYFFIFLFFNFLT